MLGMLWILFTPLVLLLIYTLVFGLFLGVKWSDSTGTDVGYVLPMFTGLIFYLYFSELITSSTGLLTSKRSMILKSSFPIWVPLLSNIIRCSFQFIASIVILLTIVILTGQWNGSGFFYSLISLVVGVIFLAGLAVIFAILGPFVGDLSQVVRQSMRVIFYTAPISYPASSVPERFQIFLWMNPLTFIVESFRSSLLFGKNVDLSIYTAASAVTTITLLSAVWIYKRTKGVLSDVL